MGIVNYVCIGVAILSMLFAASCYRQLWKWARQCQHARIAVAYKKRVQLQAPLVEWLLWTNQLDKDKASQGRVVYSRAGVSVAIAKAVRPPGKVRQAIRSTRAKKGAAPPSVREGNWSAKDQTPQENRVREELRRG